MIPLSEIVERISESIYLTNSLTEKHIDSAWHTGTNPHKWPDITVIVLSITLHLLLENSHRKFKESSHRWLMRRYQGETHLGIASSSKPTTNSATSNASPRQASVTRRMWVHTWLGEWLPSSLYHPAPPHSAAPVVSDLRGQKGR